MLICNPMNWGDSKSIIGYFTGNSVEGLYKWNSELLKKVCNSFRRPKLGGTFLQPVNCNFMETYLFNDMQSLECG